LRNKEIVALSKLRDYDKDNASIDEVIDAVMEYSRPLMWSEKSSIQSNENKISMSEAFFHIKEISI
jgi:hypothetical protein